AMIVSTLLIGLTARLVPAKDAPVERIEWNREGAASYLDERMDVWFAKANKLQTGQSATVCVSCHTTVPYALSRSALRRAMHVNSPTPQDARLLEETTRRVESYDSN